MALLLAAPKDDTRIIRVIKMRDGTGDRANLNGYLNSDKDNYQPDFEQGGHPFNHP